MALNPHELTVQPDTFRVSKDAMLIAELRSALAVCLHDDTQGVGGVLHLPYVVMHGGKPMELTDNMLSSGLLLMDRFCKELRVLGARKHSWKVRIYSHLPGGAGMQAPAATALDLMKAYFADSRRPVEDKEVQHVRGVCLRMHAREGHIWMSGADSASACAPLSVALIA